MQDAAKGKKKSKKESKNGYWVLKCLFDPRKSSSPRNNLQLLKRQKRKVITSVKVHTGRGLESPSKTNRGFVFGSDRVLNSAKTPPKLFFLWGEGNPTQRR